MDSNSVCIIGYGYVGSLILEYLEQFIKYKITCITTSNPPTTFPNVTFKKSQFQLLPIEFYNEFDVIVLCCGVNSPNEKCTFSESVYKEVLSFTYLLDLLLPNQKLIYMSSSSVYGDTSERVVAK